MMAEADITAAALVKAKGDAEDWLKNMVAAMEYIMKQQIISQAEYPDTLIQLGERTWKTLRAESHKLLQLRDDQFTIVEELKKVQQRLDDYNSKTDNLKMSIALLHEALDLGKRGKARSAKASEIKMQKKEAETESIKNEIEASTNHRTHPRSGDYVQKHVESLLAKKASLEEKLRCYRERVANELASFDSKIRESEVELEKKTSKLNRIEANVVVVGETLKVMKDALRCCEEVIPMFQLVFINRLRSLKCGVVRVDLTSDVGIIKRIYVLRDRLRGFQLSFAVCRIELCPEISKIYRGIHVKLKQVYILSIDEGGLFHIRHHPLPAGFFIFDGK